MPWTDPFAPVEAEYRSQVMEATWGHLAPKKNKSYRLRIVYAVGCFGNDPLNPVPLVCDSGDLESSPWFYDAVLDFISEQKSAEGGVYEFVGKFRNYEFYGTLRTLANYSKVQS